MLNDWALKRSSDRTGNFHFFTFKFSLQFFSGLNSPDRLKLSVLTNDTRQLYTDQTRTDETHLLHAGALLEAYSRSGHIWSVTGQEIFTFSLSNFHFSFFLVSIVRID